MVETQLCKLRESSFSQIMDNFSFRAYVPDTWYIDIAAAAGLFGRKKKPNDPMMNVRGMFRAKILGIHQRVEKNGYNTANSTLYINK